MLTTYFSFIRADYKDVADTIYNLKKDRFQAIRHDATLSFDLTPDKNSPRYAKMVLWGPSDNQTVISGNQTDGFDVLCRMFNWRFGYDVVMISLTTDLDNRINDEEIYQCRFFQYLGKQNYERMVRVMQDPRWDFFEMGEPLPFEQTEKYTERIKKKRLTNDMILDYVEAMGYDVRNPDFWKSDNATYLEWSKIPIDQQNK